MAQALAAHAPDAAGQVLVVAVSGGIDSMVLLDTLWRLSPELRTRLHVAHLDHQLRDEAAADRRLVEAHAALLGLPVTCGAADVRALAAAAGRSLEDAARQARYAFLDQVAAAVGSRYVVLGHQANDQAETVLLHLLRGSGATGLAGMRPVRSGRYLRPLLQVSREQITAYAAAAGVPFRQDRSNDDVRFARNRVRHRLLPVLRQYNPGVERALGRTARLLADEDACLGEQAGAARAHVQAAGWIPGQHAGLRALDAGLFFEYHIAIRRRVVRALLGELSGACGGVDCACVDQALACFAGPDGAVCRLGPRLAVQRAGRWLLAGSPEAAAVDLALAVPGQVLLADRGIRLHVRVEAAGRDMLASPPDGRAAAALDLAAVGACLRLRSPRRGDLFQPHGMAGRKKLSDFLIDIKWPRLLRPGVLLLTGVEGQVLWVLGLRTAAAVRITAGTRQAIVAGIEPVDDQATVAAVPH